MAIKKVLLKSTFIFAYCVFLCLLLLISDIIYTRCFERLPLLKTEIYLQTVAVSMHKKSNVEGLFYEMKPAYKDDAYLINSQGMRDDEPDTVKNRFRVLVLGDSVTIGGRNLKQEQLFTEVAEKINNNGERKVEILNAGVNGYNTRQEFLALKNKYFKLKPNLVIFAFCINDLHEAAIQYLPDDYPQKEILASGIKPQSCYYKNLNNTQYLSIVLPNNFFLPDTWDRYLLSHSGIYRTSSLTAFKLKHGIKNINNLPNFLTSSDFENTLQDIKNFCRNKNLTLRFLILPTTVENDMGYVLECLSRNKIEFWDLNPRFKNTGLSIWGNDGIHLTAIGHEITGELLAQKIGKLIPEAP